MQLRIKNNNFHVYRIKIAGKSLPIMLFPREKPPGFYTKLCLATLKEIKYFCMPLFNALMQRGEYYKHYGVHKVEFSEKMAEKLSFR